MCVYICTYIYTYIHMYVCAYMYTCTRTYVFRDQFMWQRKQKQLKAHGDSKRGKYTCMCLSERVGV